MKLLVLSDSHGATRLMAEVVKKYASSVAAVLFLGDYVRDIERIGRHSLPFHVVAGNCDFGSQYPWEIMVELGGKKIWLTHGHNYGVKTGYDRIIAAAAAKGAEICLFGHSHLPVIFEKNGIVFLNPGSITEPRGAKHKSYAVIEILPGGILPKIIEIKG